MKEVWRCGNSWRFSRLWYQPYKNIIKGWREVESEMVFFNHSLCLFEYSGCARIHRGFFIHHLINPHYNFWGMCCFYLHIIDGISRDFERPSRLHEIMPSLNGQAKVRSQPFDSHVHACDPLLHWLLRNRQEEGNHMNRSKAEEKP